uniref:Uncharacterized protein n=1 Tax=Steinernema glaseri TaxID=37863 RepID=A0A1I7YFM6_9BILA
MSFRAKLLEADETRTGVMYDRVQMASCLPCKSSLFCASRSLRSDRVRTARKCAKGAGVTFGQVPVTEALSHHSSCEGEPASSPRA